MQDEQYKGKLTRKRWCAELFLKFTLIYFPFISLVKESDVQDKDSNQRNGRLETEG